jgi:hypothetical protein
LQPANLGDGRVIAAVVDIDDLVIEKPVESGVDLGHKQGDIAGLIFDRNDDGKIHATDDGSPNRAADTPSTTAAATSTTVRQRGQIQRQG